MYRTIKPMIQTVELSHEQQVAMYMKLPKKRLIQMLIEANRIINMEPVIPNLNPEDTLYTYNYTPIQVI